MRVAQVWRYPVKSMQGESLDALDIDVERVPGDREWGVRDSTTSVVLTARLTRQLLQARATRDGEGVRITMPDGRELRDGDEHTDLALSSLVGQPVQLVRAKSDEQATFETPVLFSDASPDTTLQWQSRPGSFNDGNPVHILTTASLRAAAKQHPSGQWDARRFRPNVLIEAEGDDFVEDSWTSVRIGDLDLEIIKRTTRCVLTSRAQPGLVEDIEVPRSLARNRNAKLGVYARVSEAGTIDAGADVRPG